MEKEKQSNNQLIRLLFRGMRIFERIIDSHICDIVEITVLREFARNIRCLL